jgi:hypothetical protein
MNQEVNPPGAVPSQSAALRFVVLLGVVSLLADITYEGARSLSGPYLNLLGASATVVGITAGFGEFIGYALRLVSGWLTDRTQKYWALTILGYAVNLLAVPLLALAGSWEIAVGLLIAERLGKAIRTPARDVMLSNAAGRLGRGWGFGLHEALDQIGGVSGPLLMAAALYARTDYRTAFGLLLIPALLALAVLVAARFRYSQPEQFEPRTPKLETRGFPRLPPDRLSPQAATGRAGQLDPAALRRGHGGGRCGRADFRPAL